MLIFSGHGIEILNVVIEICLVCAFYLHPERNWRIKIICSKFWKLLKFFSVGAIKQFSKAVKEIKNVKMAIGKILRRSITTLLPS